MSAQSTAGKSHRTRRYRPRYNLRVQLALYTLIIAWFALRTERAHRQHFVATWVATQNGSVRYDYEPDRAERVRRRTEARDARISGKRVPTYVDEPSVPRWLRKLCGEDYFRTIEGVQLSHTNVTDEDLRYLTKLHDLRELSLANTSITDAGLRHLTKLKKLERLALQGTDITDEGMQIVGRTRSLKEIDVMATQVTLDKVKAIEGLRYVKVMTNRR